jgi:hypothetical protein
MPQKKSPAIWYISGVVALCLVGAIYYFANQGQEPYQAPAWTPRPSQTQGPTLPRSKAPGIITSVSASHSVDAKGNAVQPAAAFAKTDKTIYLVLSLNKPKAGTKIEYIRYLNGKLLDSGATKLLKSNLSVTSFIWALKKPGSARLPGAYTVKVYTNGVFEKQIFFSIK